MSFITHNYRTYFLSVKEYVRYEKCSTLFSGTVDYSTLTFKTQHIFVSRHTERLFRAGQVDHLFYLSTHLPYDPAAQQTGYTGIMYDSCSIPKASYIYM